MISFRMKIVDVFHFRDGRTVLIGPVEGQQNFLPSCTCELLVNGQLRQVVAVEGEMISDPCNELGYRSVSSMDKLTLEPHEIAGQECVLKALMP